NAAMSRPGRSCVHRATVIKSCPAGTGTTDLKESLRVAAAGSAATATSRIDPPRVESLLQSAHRVKESSQSAASISDLRNVAPQPRVEPEAAAGREHREQEHQRREEHVAPRPLSRIARFVDAQPQMQHVEPPDDADKTHAEPQDQRDGEGEL